MPDKELRFVATLDESQLSQSFANITQKMKAMQGFTSAYADIAKGAAGGQLPGMTPQAQQAYESSLKRSTDSAKQAYKDQLASIEMVARKMKETDSILSQENQKLKDKTRSLEEQAEIQQKITDLMKDQATLDQEFKGRTKEAGALANAANIGQQQNTGLISSIASAVGISTAIMVAKQVGEEFVRRQVDITKMQGSAIAGTTGKVLSQMQTGEFAYEGIFGDERKRATGQSKTAEERGRVSDIAQMLSGVGLLAGAAIAASTGGLGTPLIPALGALGTTAGLAFGAGGLLAYNKRNMFDREKYEAQKTSQFAQDFNETFEAEKQKSPYKTDAVNKLQKNASAMLNYQRMLGLSDSAMFANLQSTDFTDEMLMNSSQGILGAGGGTAMGRRSDIALKAQRNMGLTNSPQLLGMISGTQGIPETSKKTLIDIFAQGQSIGLDSSKYAQENRQFMQNVAESVSRGGTTSESAADTIAKIMGSFTNGATTMKGIEQGKGAYETFQNNVSETSGYKGGINIAGLLSADKRFGNIKDPAILRTLVNLKPQELDQDDPFIRSAAMAAGMSPEELVRTLGGSKIKSAGAQLARPNALKKFAAEEQSWKTRKGGTGDLTGFFESKDTLNSPDFAQLVSMHQTLNPGENLKQAEAGVRGIGDLTNMTDKERQERFKTQATSQMEGEGPGRNIDRIVSASAQNAQVALKTLSDSITDFANNSLKAAGQMSQHMTEIQKANQDVQNAKNAVDAAQAHLDALTAHRVGGRDRATQEAQSVRDQARENYGNAQKQAEGIKGQMLSTVGTGVNR